MGIPVPSLSGEGWINSLERKADKLFTDFYTSDFNQTSLYPGQVANMQRVIELYGNDMISLCLKMRDTLEIYLGRYYTDVRVTVDSDDITSDNQTGKINLKVDIRVTEDGKPYSFGALIETLDSKFQNVTKLNNG